MTLWNKLIHREPVRVLLILAGMIPLVSSGLQLFGIYELNPDQLAYLAGLPTAIGVVVGSTVIRNRVTPVPAELITPLWSRRAHGLVNAVPDSDPNDNRFTAFLGDAAAFFAPASGASVNVSVVSPSRTYDIPADKVTKTDPIRDEYGARWHADLGHWVELGAHTVMFRQGGNVILYHVDVRQPPAFRHDVITTRS